MSYYLSALKKYAVFQGRARRSEYWLFYLFSVIVILVPVMLLAAISGTEGGLFEVILALVMLFHVLPFLSVSVRRLHDTGRSGWWYWISLIPIVGGFIMLYFLVLDGESATNQYGPDPKGRHKPTATEIPDVYPG